MFGYALGFVLLVLLVIVLVVAAVVLFAVALNRRSKAQLAAGVEVVPGMPTGAPAEWAGQHTPEAKLHRRLTGLARSLAAIPLGDAASIERRSTVEQHIQQLDQRLIGLASAPDAARQEAVAELEPEVASAEAEVGKLATEPPLG
ncbi:MAG: hypothetical protein QOJ80_1626 [Mycobacterium sp.]|nr:hypothetical protein [Mycobacterium sp.]